MVNSAVKKGLSGNALKYIALAAMTLDHVALAFFGGVAAEGAQAEFGPTTGKEEN